MLDASSLIAQSEALAQRGEWSQAASLLAAAEPSLSILEKRAYYLSRAGSVDEALAVLTDMRARYPDDFKPYFLTGYQHLKKGEFGQAAIWLGESAARNPAHLPTLERLAFALSKAGDRDQGAKYAALAIKEWLQLDDRKRGAEVRRYVSACCLLGKHYLHSDPYVALEYYEAASRNDPTNPWTLYGLGCALGAVGRHNDALAALHRASELKPGDVWIELERIAATIRSGKPEVGLRNLVRLKSRLRAWEAERGARLAMLAGNPSLAIELIDTAVGSRAVRKHPRVAKLRDDALRSADESGQMKEIADEIHTGRIDILKPDRGFGFLVDDRDRVRRHFRFHGGGLSTGDRVEFRPLQAEKGPAADKITPIATKSVSH